MIAARFTLFSSSRTLPGQEKRSMARRASWVETQICLSALHGEALENSLGQQAEIPLPLPQRRQCELHHREPVKQSSRTCLRAFPAEIGIGWPQSPAR